MKIKLASFVTCTLLAPTIFNGNIHSVYAEKNNNLVVTKQDEVDREGLIGYYFRGENFSNLVLSAPTKEHTLIYDQETANNLLDIKNQKYQSIRWVGLLQSKETGDFIFQFSNDQNTIIEIEGKVVSNKGNDKQVVHLERGKLVQIKIDYQSNEVINPNNENFNNFKLFKVDNKNQSHQVQQDELKNPEFNKKETQEKLSEFVKTNLLSRIAREDEDLDTDGDTIPDAWEKNGYTIQRKIAVKWNDSLASKGYKKFLSNPYEAHTVGDPYTDYEKAARDIPGENSEETNNPLVAAFPSVNVGLEKVVISKNEDMSQSVGSSNSTNWSYTNTFGVDVHAGWEGIGPSFGVSINYQNSQTSATEWGSSTENSTHLNGAQSAFLNANVRYYNVGTSGIYDVKPTVSFVLDGTTIGTIKAKENITALNIEPKDSYPRKGQNGIAINTMDDFSSHPIPLNKQQLATYISNKKPILLETNQTEGRYVTKDTSGQTIVSGTWNGIEQQIKNRTASIIVDTGENVSEKRVAGKNFTNPEDLTPEVTLKEALKLAYPDDIKEKDGLLFYNDQPIFEESVQSYVDEYTAKRIRKQLNDNNGNFKDVKDLYDVKLEPKMNFTIKPSTLYDGAENPRTSLGAWYNTGNILGGHTGKRQYKILDNTLEAAATLSPEKRKKLKKNTVYYVSLLMKADSDVPVHIIAESGYERINSVKASLNRLNYQRVNLLVTNTEEYPIDAIAIRSEGDTRIYWDDVAFVEVGAVKS